MNKREAIMNTFTCLLPMVFIVWGPASTLCGQSMNAPVVQRIVLQGEGIEMEAFLYLPRGKGPFPAAIVLPGGGRPQTIGTVGPHDRYFGSELAERGIAALVLDYNDPSRVFLDPRKIQDIGAAVEFLKKEGSIQKENIHLVGFSMGGANALRVAGSRDDIAGLVCYFTPNDWRIREKRFPVKIDRQPVEYCAGISCPVLVLHGDGDIVTEVQQGIHLHETLKALKKDVKLVIYEGAAHGFTYKGHDTGRVSYNAGITAKSLGEVEAFIARNL